MGVTREAILKINPDATAEQIDAMMAEYNKALQEEREKSEKRMRSVEERLATFEKNQADFEKVRADFEKRQKEAANKDLSAEEIVNQKLAEIEKANAEKEAEKDARIKALEAQVATEKINNYAASNGLTGETFSKVLNAINGDVDLAKAAIDGIVALKGEWETGAALAKEQEIAKQSGNPGSNAGSTSTGDDFGKDIAIQAAKRAGTANEEILKHYRR